MYKKIAFQGEYGAYSEEAAFKYFGDSIQTIGCKTLQNVFQILDKNEVDFAIVPIENSIEGSIGQTYDLLLKYNLKSCGEVFHRIKHCLISFPSNNLESIQIVYSHPQALGQCRKFLEEFKFEIIPFYDTAGSVKMIKEKNLQNAAGIASERAAKIYGMKVIADAIESNHNNFTRFLILSTKDSEPTGNDKTSIIFATKHIPGALYKAIGIFSVSDINLTKIESRPILGKPWEYTFYLDLEGHYKDKIVSQALGILKHNSIFMKIIGSYPKAKENFGKK